MLVVRRCDGAWPWSVDDALIESHEAIAALTSVGVGDRLSWQIHRLTLDGTRSSSPTLGGERVVPARLRAAHGALILSSSNFGALVAEPRARPASRVRDESLAPRSKTLDAHPSADGREHFVFESRSELARRFALPSP